MDVDKDTNHLLQLMDERDKRYNQRFEAQEKAVTAALDAAKEAVLKAEAASDKRFDGVNEFRATLADQQRTLMPRAEAELRLKALEDASKVGVGQSSGLKAGWGWAVAIIGFSLAIYGFISR